MIWSDFCSSRSSLFRIRKRISAFYLFLISNCALIINTISFFFLLKHSPVCLTRYSSVCLLCCIARAKKTIKTIKYNLRDQINPVLQSERKTFTPKNSPWSSFMIITLLQLGFWNPLVHYPLIKGHLTRQHEYITYVHYAVYYKSSRKPFWI